jgi:predicted HTH transcriptional regulator
MNETQHIEWKQSWRDDALRGICGAHGSPPPILRWDNGSWVELPFNSTQEQERAESFQPEWRLESRLESALAARIVMLLAAQAMGKEVLGQGARLDEKLDERLDEKLGENRAAIIRLMRKNSRITVSEVAKALQISRTAADKNIQVLKAKDYIRRVGPAKGGHWEVLK